MTYESIGRGAKRAVRKTGKLTGKNDGIVRGYDLRKPHVKVFYAALTLLCLAAVVVSLLPLIYTILGGFKTIQELTRGVKTVGPDGKSVWRMHLLPQNFSMEGYIDTWKKTKFARHYVNSFIQVAGSMVSACLFNGLFAYGLAILRPRGWKIALAVVMGSLLLPGTTSIVPLYININRIGLQGSFIPLWLGVGASAFYVILFKNFYEAMPVSLIEAARLDGCSDLGLFFKIVLPLSMPINMVVLIYAVNGAWSDFLLPYLLLNNSPRETVMVRLFTLGRSKQVSAIDLIRAMMYAILPPVALFIAFQRQITSNVLASGIKG